MPWAISKSRLREKLSKAGPAKGRTSSADSVNELTTTPTMEAVAPSESGEHRQRGIGHERRHRLEEVYRHQNDKGRTPNGVAPFPLFGISLHLFQNATYYTLNLKCMTSPSWTT